MRQGDIYIFDLHNTLYDEVIEFGSAMAETLDYLFSETGALDKDLFFDQLSKAHARLGSDWDNDVWHEIPALQRLPNLTTIIDRVVAIRNAASERLTKSYAYIDTIQTIRELKQAGNTIYIATEATQNAASDAVFWLELDDVVDAVYTWPFAKPYINKCNRTCFETFPADLQKPHPRILGAILLDHAKRSNLVPQNVTVDDVFEFSLDETLDIGLLGQEALRAIRTVMTVKDGPYAEIMNAIKSRCFYVGDSFFRDGFLARNAEIPFIHAAYGKKIAPADIELEKKAKETLFRVTGWDKFVIKLTQEAGALPELTDRIKPHYVCADSFREFIEFRKGIDENG